MFVGLPRHSGVGAYEFAGGLRKWILAKENIDLNGPMGKEGEGYICSLKKIWRSSGRMSVQKSRKKKGSIVFFNPRLKKKRKKELTSIGELLSGELFKSGWKTVRWFVWLYSCHRQTGVKGTEERKL